MSKTNILNIFNNSGRLMNRYVSIAFFFVFVFFLTWIGISEYNADWNVSRVGRFIACCQGDTRSYIQPIEHYIQSGSYYLYEPDEQFVGRGPYYGVYYFIFRLFLPEDLAYDAVAMFQILLYSFVLVLLMYFIEKIIKHKFLILIIPLYVLFNKFYGGSTQIITECLTSCLMLLFVMTYYKFQLNNDKRFLLISALFLAMAAVMKPYFLPIYAICCIDYAIKNIRIISVNDICKYIIIMSIPLVLICIPFTIRNAYKYHIFAPMQNTGFAGMPLSKTSGSIRKLIRFWGEDYINWEEDALGTYFYPEPGVVYEGDLPDDIIADGYTKNDIVKLKDDYQVFLTLSEDDSMYDSLSVSIQNRVQTYYDLYYAQHPLAPLTSRLMALHRLFKPGKYYIDQRHNGVRFYISNSVLWGRIVLYWILIIGGLVGLVLVSKNIPNLRFVLLIALYIILFFSYTCAGEHRFLLLVEYLCFIGLIYIVDWIYIKIKSTANSK